MATNDQKVNKNSADNGDDLKNFLAQIQAEMSKQPVVAAPLPNKDYLLNRISEVLKEWQFELAPCALGEKFVVGRSWKKVEINANPNFQSRILVQIDPGIAFGSNHPCTQACVQALEQYWHGGRMLDIGTGTGILSIVAAHLQPAAQIEAFDVIPDIVEHAKLHLALNEQQQHVQLRTAFVDDYPEASYDLICANLLPDLLLGLKEKIIARLKPGGTLIMSGFLQKGDQRIYASFDWNITESNAYGADTILAAYQEAGLSVLKTLQIDRWAAAVLMMPGKENQ